MTSTNRRVPGVLTVQPETQALGPTPILRDPGVDCGVFEAVDDTSECDYVAGQGQHAVGDIGIRDGAGGVSVVTMETGLPSLKVKNPIGTPLASTPVGRPLSKSSTIEGAVVEGTTITERKEIEIDFDGRARSTGTPETTTTISSRAPSKLPSPPVN